MNNLQFLALFVLVIGTVWCCLLFAAIVRRIGGRDA